MFPGAAISAGQIFPEFQADEIYQEMFQTHDWLRVRNKKKNVKGKAESTNFPYASMKKLLADMSAESQG